MAVNAPAANLEAAANALHLARSRREAILPISRSYGITDIESAYAVADINTRRRVDAGARVVGMKVGLTSCAVQQQLGVDQPDFGVLFDDMERLSGEPIEIQGLLQPKAEVEVAFVLRSDLSGAGPSIGEFLAALAYAIPAIEIVDSAISDWKISLADTVADNASCGLYVLGDQPTPLGQIPLAELGMQMFKNGALAATGCGSACMGHPLRAAYWLARTMSERGRPLKAGQVILSGALGPMVPVAAGDRIDATLGPLGQVSCHFI
ncbi:fumarylacetoacetate hydrolase family protein [Massilia sp. BJB1822]|nr:fumarylacetoacetate hydrolase family protein [Massilia sp. BJB1822]